MSITIPGTGPGAPGVRTVRASDVDESPICSHLPPMTARELARAAHASDIEAIDAITDRLAAEGVVRQRGDTTMLGQLRDACRGRP